MGKDFTPQQLHFADKIHKISEIEDLKTETLKEGKLPNLGYLFCNRIDELVDTFRREERDMRILEAVERELKSVITNDDLHVLTEYQDVEPIHTITQWYLGKLAPRFHYNTENDQLFFEYILSLKWEDVKSILAED